MDIRTTRDLRKFLADVMVDVRADKVTPNQAGAIAKLCSQINQSISIEVNAALRQGLEQGKFVEAQPMRLADDGISRPEHLTDDQVIWCEQCDGSVEVGEARQCKSQFCTVRERIKES